jgi:hypothetical protein
MAEQSIPAKYMEGLRLPERDRAHMIEQIKKSGMADRRKSPRVVVEGSFSVLLTMDAPGGSTSHFRIYPWDLSRGGVGFFHRSFVYPGTRCTFAGLTFDGQPFSIKGEVVRCSHVSGNVHAVGTKLEAEIDPEQILGPLDAGVSGSAGDGSSVQDWWSKVGASAAAISKLAREKAPVDAIRKAGAVLAEHLAADPATPANATPADAPAPAAKSAAGHAPAHDQKPPAAKAA